MDMGLWGFWGQCIKWSYKEWEGKEPIMAYSIITITSLLAIAGVVVASWMQTLLGLLALIPLFITITVYAPYRLYLNKQSDLQAKIDNVNSRLQFLEDERIPRFEVKWRVGRRYYTYEHPHLMWIELDIKNISSSQSMSDVEVQVKSLISVLPKQDQPNTYLLCPLHQFNPTGICWSEQFASPNQLKIIIPSGITKSSLLAFEDDSNGLWTIYNSPILPKPRHLNGAKIEIEISSPDSTPWKDIFYIECHPNYTDGTNARFEFETWGKWLESKGISDSQVIKIS
jgi:hypothetical protein